MIKFKSISKRAIALILAILTMMSCGILSAVAANVELAETGGTITNLDFCYLVGSHQGWNASDSNWKLSTSDNNKYTGTFYVPYSSTNYQIKYYMGKTNSWNNWYSIGGYWYTSSSYTFSNVAFTSNGDNDQVQNISTSSGYNKWDVTIYGSYSSNSYAQIKQTAVTALGGSVNASATTVKSGETVTLTPSGTGGSGSYSYSYSTTGGTLSKTSGSSTVFTAPTVSSPTTYTITTTIKDAHTQLSGLTAKTVTKTITVNPNNVTATFKYKDSNGNDKTDTVTVAPNTTPTAPTVPDREGYTFTGWSPAVGAITSNTVYTAQYRINTYSVKFFDKDGNQIGDTQTVEHGSAATAPTPPTIEGWTFAAWDKSFDNITANTNVTAIYTKTQYKVTFEDYDGTQIGEEQTVNYNETPNTPDDPTREGYDFAGWTPKVGPLTGNELTVVYTATYKAKTYSLTVTENTNAVISVDGNNGDGTVSHGETITLNATQIAATHKFSKWVVTNNGVTTEYTTEEASFEVKGAVTVELVLAERVFHTISISQTDGTGTVTSNVGTITNNQLNLEEGTAVTVTVTAPSGYYISEINGTANSNQGKTEEKFTFASLSKDETISVKYAIKTAFTVTVTNMNTDAGSFTINNQNVTSITGYHGDQFTLNATANTGYVFDSFTVNGSEKTTNPLTMAITGDMNISVNWKEQAFDGYIIVQDNAGWGNVNAYVWKNANKEEFLGAYPGTQMTEIGTNLYAIRVPLTKEDLANSTYSIILNNNNDSQKTADIVMEPDVNYYVLSGTNTATPGYSDVEVNLPIKVYFDNGADKTTTRGTSSTNTTIGVTSIDSNADGVQSVSSFTQTHRYDNGTRIYYDTGYFSAVMDENTTLTVTTTIQSDCTEYKVEGFLINGTEYITANYMGDGKYEMTYTFTENSVVVPVYFYTDEYIKAEELEVITLYSQRPSDVATGWGKYMAAYVWYESGDNTDYMFGSWPGQVMVPVEGVKNYWETKVVAASPNDYPASGITFSNYGGWSDTTGVMHPVTDSTNIQVNDYYEFITLAEQGSKNITFVLKEGSDNNAPSSANTSAPDASFYTNYTDYSGYPVDILNNRITDSAASADASLYIIHDAPISDHTAPLDGYFYVNCYVYTSTGTFLGTFKSYQLLQLDSENTSIKNMAGTTVDFASYAGKRVMIDYECQTNIGEDGGTKNQAPRYDGQWYKEALKAKISVNVAETTDKGATYTITSNSPANSDTYGEALVGGGDVYEADRGDKITLSATPKAGYKFIGWYNADGVQVGKTTAITVSAVIDATYTAVFQALGDGEFVVTHEIYKAGGSSAYVPMAHGGRADLYIGIVNNNTGETFNIAKTGQASVSATENDVLTITVGTDPLGADRFYSWYIDAVDKYGLTTYEEVGVDNYDGSDQYGNLYENIYENGVDTLEGTNQMVYFQFKYVVKPDIFTIHLYSDVVPKSADATLIYKYDNRYGEERTVYVPYVLTDEEIDGCAGNGYKPFTPTEQTIYDHAPYVEDFYKDTKWIINENRYTELTYELWATQPETVYTVTVNAGGTLTYKSGVFNTEVEINARDFNSTLTNSGFWYIDVNENVKYEEGIDQILSYGMYYGLRITDDMMIGYQLVEQLEFDVLLSAPEYGREQTTDEKGNLLTDFIYIDYLETFLVPYFNGNTTEDGKKIDGVYYEDELIPTANTSVTLETLEKLGYEFDYGLILEQLNPNIVDTAWGEELASETTLTKVASGEEYGFVDNTNQKYYTKSSAKDNFNLTNKNRLLFTIKMDNTAGNRARYYNVYGYIAVTDSNKNTTYYFSNQQTLNILDVGTSQGNQQLETPKS